MNRDTGIRNLFPGVRFDSEVEEDRRSQMEIRKRLEQMATFYIIVVRLLLKMLLL